MIRRIALVALALALGWPRAAAADSAIQTVAAKVSAPTAGTTETLQIGLTSIDGTTWDPQSYTVALAAADNNGQAIASAAAAPGDTPVVPGQTAFVFANLALPSAFTGALSITVTVVHNGATFVSQPIGIAVSSPAAVAAAAKPVTFTGKVASTTAFKPPIGEDDSLNITAKDGDDSFTGNAELSTTPGTQPLLQVQTPGTVSQFGTFSPSYDSNVLAGVNGQGASFLRSWGTAHQLQATYIAAEQATLNPFEITAASYSLPVRNNALTFTAGYEHTSGPLPTPVVVTPGATPAPALSSTGQPFFMSSGEFAGITYQVKSQTGVTYAIHYSLFDYDDVLSGLQRAASALAATLGFTFAKIAWTANYMRAGTYYPNLTAPDVTPDRETASLAGTFSLGTIKGNLDVNGYRNDIDDVIDEAATHFWTETLALSTTRKDGDQISLNLTNGVLHETGDPTALFQGNDSSSLTYAIPRGPYSYQLSYTSSTQHDDEGNLTHTVQEGVTVGRNASPGLSAALGLTLNEIAAAMAQAGSFSTSANGSFTYTAGTLSVSGSVTRSLMLPNVGEAQLPGIVITYTVQDQPKRFPFGFSAGVTRNVGPTSYTTGTFGMVRSF